ncbi:glycosyltransferase [Pyrococcus abyssi]|uniref:Dolichyl-phosphate mannoosyltransferase related protein n=1 Tax=Pyrococcus abyssi (strain GE5 / Orsay) TaxID=272844 RepID=Q9UXX5_PYRAB|nr:glycosyltransferase [Pyrococcus abyssi]CAB50638.1 Probable glycosyltransferase [Pyrococcus abyssi GE5]CCE71206.1 TPA: dolichyl-phosphate mannoosyltransferase related protein [Pyrococcus abyssi GE5]
MKVVVGIPSYNNADTIGYVVKQAAEGLKKYFGGGIIVNSDGGSTDGTRDVVLSTKVPEGVEVYSFVYKWPIPGKGSAMKEIMEFAREKGADAVVFVDSDLRSITPEWIYKFAKPIEEGYDFVAPLYLRHKWDGTITNNIAYPMTASLYGLDVRQPIGGDFGISARMIDLYLEDESLWKTDVARFGVDIFLTTTAIANKKKIIQVSLGMKIHNPKDPAASLGPMFNQVVGTLFMLMKKYEEVWRDVRELRPVETWGEEAKGEPEEVKVNLELLKQRAQELFLKEEATLKKIFSEEIFEEVKEAIKTFEFPDELWAKVLFEGAVAYRDGLIKNAEPLIPLYFAKTADFVIKTLDMPTIEAEKLIKERARTFLREKDYLINKWFG